LNVRGCAASTEGKAERFEVKKGEQTESPSPYEVWNRGYRFGWTILPLGKERGEIGPFLTETVGVSVACSLKIYYLMD